MSEYDYKGYSISTTVAYFPQGASVTETVYRVTTSGKLVREDTVYGPFDSPEDAHTAADAAARLWIDQHGDKPAAGSPS